MSQKTVATTHGADVVTRLRLYGPESDYNGVMTEAAEELERLRPAIVATYQGLGALPNGIVVRSEGGTIAARYDSLRGVVFGDERTFPWMILELPVTVLWQP